VVTPEALRLLTTFQWPGNIRQLENALFRAVVLAEGDNIGVGEFPQISAQLSAVIAAPVQAEVEQALADYPVETVRASAPSPTLPLMPPVPPLDALPLLDATGDVRPLEEIEAELIRYAISHYRGQMSEVARRLQIGRSTLYRKLEALGLNVGSAEGEPEGVAAERQPRKIA
jgi:DNA-binding NtrC family response regulator